MFFKAFRNRDPHVPPAKRHERDFRWPAKMMRVMKLTFVLFFALCLHVSANSSAQSITYSGKNVPLERIFTEIEKQTGNVVFVSKQLLKDASRVSVTVKDMPLQNFLSVVLKDQPLDYIMEQQTVFIRRKAIPAAPVFMPISGTITDSAGTRLEGASIHINGGTQSVVSDKMGQFTINAQPGDVLIISYVGYKTARYTIRSSQPIMISLARESTSIAEVAITVNTGYQSLPRERATGSFSIVSGKQLDNKLRPDLKAALEGQIAGMVIGRDGSLEVRGVSSFRAETQPLIIVDGYPISGGLETINIDNIESVTLLKDGVAASIYGARSSNGVLVVTTKQGRSGELRMEYRGSVGIVQEPDLSYLRRASAADYVDAEIDLYNQDPNSILNRYNSYSYLSRVNYLMLAKSQGLMSDAEADAEIAQLKQNDGIGQLQRYLFRNQVTHQHNLSITGGNEKSQVAASAKYITNRGNTLYTGDDRLILDVRNDWKPAKFISVRLLSNVNYSTAEAPKRPMSDFLNYHSAYNIHPYDLLVNPSTGQYQDIYALTPRQAGRYEAIAGMKPLHYNPLQDLGTEMENRQNLQVRLGGTVNVRLMEGLSLDAGGTWTRGSYFTRAVYSKDSYRMRLGYNSGTSISNPAKHYIPDGDMVTETRNVNEAYTLRAQLNFNRSFGAHSVIAIAGTEVTRSKLDQNGYPTRFGYNDQAGTFATFNYADYNAGLYNADMLTTSYKPQSTVGIGNYVFIDHRFVSWYANASYEYDHRFLVSGSIRIDQANLFGTDPRFRYRPLWSAGATYKLSNEQFFNVSWLNKLYVRGSYGINGNISLDSGPFLIIAPDAFSNLTGDISYNISSPPNNSLRWEKTTTTNLGTDLTFFSRLNLSLDYYLRKSNDLLASDAIDPTYGYSSLTKNVGQINNTGLELALDGDVLKRKDFTWNVLGTVSFNKNKVVEYNVNYLYTSSLAPMSVTREEYPANALFSYRLAGLDENGSALFYNAKGEKVDGGALNVEDMVYSGTIRPKFVYSLTNTFRYKNFDLSFMLLAKTGHVMRKAVYESLSIQHADVGKRWKQAGDEKHTIYPKLSTFSFDVFYFPGSDVFVESGNFLKLRDASLTYNFNRSLLKKIGISNASIILQGRNLLMITANSDDRDPEAYELNAADAASADLGFTPFRPMPEGYLGLRVNF